MLVLNADTLAALQTSPLPLAFLVECELSPPLYMATTPFELELDGHTYIGAGALGRIDPVRDTGSEFAGLSFEMSGVLQQTIALVLAEQVQGRAAILRMVVFDPTTYRVLQMIGTWFGTLDVMKLKHGVETAVVTVSAEHVGSDLLRSTNSLYSDLEQQRLHPGDLGLQFVADQLDMRIIWPAASWGR